MEGTILIIGADGQVGSEFMKVFHEKNTSNELIGLTIQDIDITDYEATRKKILEIKPVCVINTAAFHKTDDCEKDVEKSFRVNCLAAHHLARLCREIDASYVYFSTDYVFNGEKGSQYTEEDIPNPLSVYGLSKFSGEQCIMKALQKHLVIRTSYVFGASYSREKGGNLVETFIKLGKERGGAKAAEDHIISPTYAHDLAQTVKALLEQKQYGLFHVVNSGKCSIYEFAEKICAEAGIQAKIDKEKQEVLNAGKAPRPLYSSMSTKKIDALGLKMPSWEDALIRYIKERRT